MKKVEFRKPRPEGSDLMIRAAMHRDHSIINMVKAAVRHREVMLAFQPVVQARDPSRVAFYEGLIRVLDETGRIIPAKDFISEVEELETGRELDCLALEEGLKELSQNPSLRLSINMSARSIGYRKWSKILARGLDRNPTVGERLILEITESSAIVVPDLVAGFMAELREKGIAFAIDDFGSGYTAFRHFRDFQFDILKIDGLFIRGIATDPDNQVITKAMVAIAQQFDMFCVAEHVEAAADAAYLSRIGVDCLQGYFFGAPTVSPPWKAQADGRRRA